MSILGFYDYLIEEICILDHKKHILIHSEDDEKATEFDISTTSPNDKLMMKSFIRFLHE